MASRLPGIQWVCFDLGSTLLDEMVCLMDRLDRASALARKLGADVTTMELLDWSEEAYTAFAPSPFRWALDRTGLPEEQQEAVYQGAPYGSSGEALYPGVRDLLRRLSAQFRLGVIANQPAGLVPRMTEYGIVDSFGLVLGSGDVGRSKPDPELFELAMRAAAPCTPDQMVMVGDRVDNDIRPARALGWRTVRIRRGLARNQVPREHAEEPDFEFDDVARLAEIL